MQPERVVPIWKDLLLLAVVCMTVWGITCGLWDIRGPDEGRYTQVAKEMLQNGNWLHLTVLDQPYDQKPPLAFWLFAAMLWLHKGVVSSGLVRLPSAIGATVVVLLTYLIGRKQWSRRAGMMAALMLASSAVFLDDAPTVELNMLYTTFITLALFAWINRPAPDRLTLSRLLLFWIGVNAAFFVKGPLAFLIIASALIWEAANLREWRNLRLLRAWAGIPITLGLVALWFYSEKSAFGQGFVAKQVGGETVGRFLQGSHSAPFWFYLPRLFTSIFPPWALLLIPATAAAWRSGRQLDRPVPTLLGWLIPPFLVLTMANGKRESYLLPLIPAFSLFSAWYVETRLAGKPAPLWLRWLAVVLAAAVAILAFGAVVVFLREPQRYAAQGFEFTILQYVVWMLGGVALVSLAVLAAKKLRRWEHGVYFVASTILVGGFLNFASINPAIDSRQTTRPLAEALRPMLANNGVRVIGALGKVAEAEYHVYGDYHVREFKPKNLRPADPTNPDVMVISEKIASANESALHNGLIAAGYREPVKLTVSKDDTYIYQRAAHP